MENIDKLVQLITEKLMERLKDQSEDERCFFLGELDCSNSVDFVRTNLVEEADVVIIGNHQLHSLLRLASLTPSNSIEEQIIEALLSGKRVYASDQNFKLQHCMQSSKSVLYKELIRKKEILEKYGIAFYQDRDLVNVLSDKKPSGFNLSSSKQEHHIFNKRTLITESKLRELELADGDTFKIEKGMIVTALAKDYLNRRNINIIY